MVRRQAEAMTWRTPERPPLYTSWKGHRVFPIFVERLRRGNSDNHLLSGNMPFNTMYANPNTLMVVVARRVIITSVCK